MLTMLFQRKIVVAVLVFTACAGIIQSHAESEAGESTDSAAAITTIGSMDELKQIINDASTELLMFDLYADWCAPCRMLAPRIRKLAAQHRDKVTVYKIDVDKSPKVASAFGARGIPYVVFVKEKKAVEAVSGIRSHATYTRIINRYTHANDSTDG